MQRTCNNSHEHLADFPEVLIEYICDRRLCNEHDFKEWTNPNYEKMHNPFLFRDMQKAVERILRAIKKNEKVVIYSDFDADGVPGAVLFRDLFEKVGFNNFEHYIPDRNTEGYGLHKSAMEKFVKNSVKLVITVDLGINAKEAVEYAKHNEVDVIISDHHESTSESPEAFAIINPKHDKNYPFDGLCGAGVAFKIVQALLKIGRNKKIKSFLSVKEGWEKWMLDLVALSTVADMVPLVDENRILVHWGLFVMRKNRRPGLNAFFKHYGIAPRQIEENDTAFSLAPKINAASRLGKVQSAFNLLTAKSLQEAQEHILELERLNKERQKIVAKIARAARQKYKNKNKDLNVVVMGDKSWHSALLGLVASRLADEYGKMFCLWGQDASGAFKGSCRNGGKGHVAKLFELSKDILSEFGGHEGAGGFSLEFENILDLEKVFNERYMELKFSEKDRDFKSYGIKCSDINWGFYEKLRLFAPFGVSNEAPIFKFENIEVVQKRLFGKHKEHLEIVFKNKNGKSSVKSVAFFAPDKWLKMDMDKISVIFAKLEKSSFAGRLELRLNLIDII